MIQTSDNKLRLLTIILTDVLLISSMAAFNQAYFFPDTQHGEMIPALVIIWLTTFIFRLRSSFFKIFSLNEQLKEHFSQVFACTGALAVFFILSPRFVISPEYFLISAISLSILIIPRVLIQQMLTGYLKNSGKTPGILLAGDGKLTTAIIDYFKHEPEEGNIIGYLSDNSLPSADAPRLGNFSDIGNVHSSNPFDRLLITADSENKELLEKLIDFSERKGIRASVVLNAPALIKRNYELSDLGGLPMFHIREVPLSDYIPLFWKRIFDVVFAASALILLFPVLLVISFLIKLDSPGPVFYRAERIGRQGKTFRIFKFRSMKTETEPGSENKSAQKNDDRITKTGKFLRRYSLDELPQLLNVLEGSMSVVGPRPHRVNLDQKFGELMPAYPIRRFIKPGITGWAQVNGWRGLTEKKIDFKGRALHDLWYLEHWSFGLDLAIIWLTVFGRRTHQNVF